MQAYCTGGFFSLFFFSSLIKTKRLSTWHIHPKISSLAGRGSDGLGVGNNCQQIWYYLTVHLQLLNHRVKTLQQLNYFSSIMHTGHTWFTVMLSKLVQQTQKVISN